MLTGASEALVKDAKRKLYSSYCIKNCVINIKKNKKKFPFIKIITFLACLTSAPGTGWLT